MFQNVLENVLERPNHVLESLEKMLKNLKYVENFFRMS